MPKLPKPTGKHTKNAPERQNQKVFKMSENAKNVKKHPQMSKTTKTVK